MGAIGSPDGIVHGGLKPLSDLLDDVVASGMSMTVIDRLEASRVEIYHGLNLVLVELDLVDVCDQPTPIEQACQFITPACFGHRVEQAMKCELVTRLTRELFKLLAFLIAECLWLVINDAEGAHWQPLLVTYFRAGVETNAIVLGHQRVVAKTLVFGCVLNYKGLLLKDRMPAERNIAIGLSQVQSNARLEPLSITINKADQRDRYAKQLRGEFGKIIKRLVRARVKDLVGVQRIKARLLFRVLRWLNHWKFPETIESVDTVKQNLQRNSHEF